MGDKIIYNITIPMTEEDCDRLRSGDEFNWAFPDKDNPNIQVNTHLRMETEEDVNGEEP